MTMFKEDDYTIEALRKDPLDLKSPMIVTKITHKSSGLSFTSSEYRSFTANKAECIYQILGMVRLYNQRYETIPFKHFSLILERDLS